MSLLEANEKGEARTWASIGSSLAREMIENGKIARVVNTGRDNDGVSHGRKPSIADFWKTGRRS